MPFARGKKPTTVLGSRITKLGQSENQEDGPHVKRSSSPPHGAPKKRAAFVDLTNAHKVQICLPGRKKIAVKKATKKPVSVATAKVPQAPVATATVPQAPVATATVPQAPVATATVPQAPVATAKVPQAPVATGNQGPLKKLSSGSSEGPEQAEVVVLEEEQQQLVKASEEVEPKVASEVEVEELTTTVRELEVAPPCLPAPQRPEIPEEFDVDMQNWDDCCMAPEYAKEIFDYLKQREEKFVLSNYMSLQPNLNPGMRAILVDWLVEVQENFELNHETLYLAVKMTDHFLAISPVARETLQLIGSTTMLIASKFEERSPPCVDDFMYICDDAYKREEIIAMETSILQALGFDISIPIPYRFLRRYCAGVGMDTLTLARYICELSLHEAELLPLRGSLLAAACLLVALVTKDLGGWSPMLEYHSGYSVDEVAPVARSLQAMLLGPPDSRLKAVRSKYAHKVFFQVASLPVVDMCVLEEALSQGDGK
ncbi:hypothetical protein NHX12_014335 [Muraenolepis orangiensis]|uniref:G2/mitotic-specific cyclin-B2 n=1 Tax=Muraenolepis orangiensis TaxID=630683 RepID=A0A9Q0DDD6_9TELE|nr:hypothetical protein NHX12_014335 [Muraenolepis orangiensis]